MRRHYELRSTSFDESPESGLIQKKRDLWPDAETEEDRYRQHQNSIDDLRYVQHLSPAIEQVQRFVRSPARGLDYGCGPDPVLAQLLERAGYQMELYDLYFQPKAPKELGVFDFVTCTEAAEHFREPIKEFEKIFQLLKPSGILVVMTQLYVGQAPLESWSYAKDHTHICFYQPKTLQWLANQFHSKLEIVSDRLAVFFLPEFSFN